jgi:hypothetical protein
MDGYLSNAAFKGGVSPAIQARGWPFRRAPEKENGFNPT